MNAIYLIQNATRRFRGPFVLIKYHHAFEPQICPPPLLRPPPDLLEALIKSI